MQPYPNIKKMSLFPIIAMFIVVALLITLMVKISEFQAMEEAQNNPYLRGRRTDWMI